MLFPESGGVLKNVDAWVMRGNAFFKANNLFDSEESYIKALRFSAEQKKPVDPILQERLGIVYAKRKAWRDAKTVFLKCCKERVSTTSWFFLGLSLLRLGELEEAEDAISQANVLDNTNPKVWGLMTILCLSTGNAKDGPQRLTQANMSFKQANDLGLQDSLLIEEIGDLYYGHGELDQALIAYRIVSDIAP
jgi:tetratricopeptide (TPR) repeat protein